jgi:hypothetical protein
MSEKRDHRQELGGRHFVGVVWKTYIDQYAGRSLS